MSTVQGPSSVEEQTFHGGRLIARTLVQHGVSKLFTLSGGHLFSIYDGCKAEGIEIVDVRHEQTATFAAEGWAKVTRQVGVCALTAGPGVTNGMSAIAGAQASHSPLLVLGGRAPALRWGQGSLQEIDHVPFLSPLCKRASTAQSPAEMQALVDEGVRLALTPHGGPVFIDFPLDHVFSYAAEQDQGVSSTPPQRNAADGDLIERAGALLADAKRPVIMAGTDLYWGHGEQGLTRLVETLQIPVFLNGLARGCVPADHRLFFSRVRSLALKQADVALLVGVPLDFRLGFGQAFGEETQVVVIDAQPPAKAPARSIEVELYGDIAETLADLSAAAGSRQLESSAFVEELTRQEAQSKDEERAQLEDERRPLHPMRLYAELRKVIDKDAIVIGDGGDFVSFAGKMIDSYRPGCWLDPGPYGCLGSGLGYALAAKLAKPNRQVVLLLGDGAFGFAGLEFDTLARHGVNVVAVMGNNGIWGLEKHPMEFLYGYSVAADLRPQTRYDQVVEALGCHGELVQRPQDVAPALQKAFFANKPALVNVLTDPSVAYPRKANLA